MPVLETNNQVDIHYQIFGSGDIKLVFVMGLTAPYQMWGLQLEHFCLNRENAQRFQVMVLDNRGAGLSAVPWLPFSISSMAGDLKEVVDHLNWSKFHLVGISMGGMVCLEFACKFEDMLASVALINTHAGGFVRTLPQMKGLLSIFHACFNFWKYPGTNLFHSLLFSDLTSPGDRATYHERLQRSSQKIVSLANHAPNQAWGILPVLGRIWRSLRGFTLQMLAVVCHHVSVTRLRRLRQSDVRVLVCVGTNDLLIRPTNSYHIQRELKADLRVFKGGGHALNQERSEELNQVLTQHIHHHCASENAYSCPPTTCAAGTTSFTTTTTSTTSGPTTVVRNNILPPSSCSPWI